MESSRSGRQARILQQDGADGHSCGRQQFKGTIVGRLAAPSSLCTYGLQDARKALETFF